MEERVRLVGGEILISSSPGQGTTIQVRVPLPEKPEDGLAIRPTADAGRIWQSVRMDNMTGKTPDGFGNPSYTTLREIHEPRQNFDRR
jgi:hypothetical protein